jgi:hypothetical protein
MRMRALWLLLGLALAGRANAQVVVHNDELLGPDRTEAWAMEYVGAATLMTPFGEPVPLAPGQWSMAADFADIPRLSQEQQQVGLHGVKQEDLNKSPVFGRLRVDVGLPAAFRLTLGWTPPVRINGLRTHDLYAIALGRTVFHRDAFDLSMRVFGQHGSAQGDITCPARIAGVADASINPFGCSHPSNDRIELRHYGADLTTAWSPSSWQWHATVGIARMEPQVQVDAVTGPIRDRSRLVARDVLPYIAIGAGRDFAVRWHATVEYLYVPLSVRRNGMEDAGNEPLRSLRLQLRRTMR